MGSSPIRVLLGCGLLSVVIPSVETFAGTNEASLASLAFPLLRLGSISFGQPRLQRLDDSTRSDVWQTLDGWLGSLCSIVGCEMHRTTMDAAAYSATEMTVAEFVSRCELQIGQRTFTLEQMLIGDFAIGQILRILDANPGIISKDLEARFRFCLQLLSTDLSN